MALSVKLARQEEASREVEVRLAVRGAGGQAPEAVSYKLDGRELKPGPGGRLLVRPGSHRLEVSAAGFVTASRSFTAAAGELIEVTLEPEPAAAAPAAEETAVVLVEQEGPPSGTYRLAGWGLAGGMAAAVLAGLWLDMSAGETLDEMDAAREQGDQPRYDSLEEEAGREQLVAGLLYGGAALLGAGAGLLLYLGYEGVDAPVSAAPALGPGWAGLCVEGRW